MERKKTIALSARRFLCSTSGDLQHVSLSSRVHCRVSRHLNWINVKPETNTGVFFLWVIASWLLSYGTKCTHTNQQHASSSDPLLVQSHLNIPPLVLTLEQLRAATISRPLSPVFIYLWAQEEHLVHFRGYVFSNKVKLPAQTKVIRCARSKWP